MKRKIALIFGGRSLESDISVITAMQVLFSIDKSQFDVEPVYLTGGDFYVKGLTKLSDFAPFDPLVHGKAILLKGEFYLFKKSKLVKYFKPDVALLCCHGGEGEGGTLQALLDFNGIPYTSADMLSSAICLDKISTKRILCDLLFNVLPYEAISKKEFEDDELSALELVERAGYPLIVKPSRLGSSIGIGVANDRDELRFALLVAFKFDDRVIVEHKLENFSEVNCAGLKSGEKVVVSQTEQPLSCNNFLTFDDKYMSGGKESAKHIIPADIGSLEGVVKANTERIFKELELNGVVRVDFLIDKDKGKVYVNEINTIPGSLAFYLFEPIGMSFSEVISVLINNAECRGFSKLSAYKTEVLSKFQGGSKGSQKCPMRKLEK